MRRKKLKSSSDRPVVFLQSKLSLTNTNQNYGILEGSSCDSFMRQLTSLEDDRVPIPDRYFHPFRNELLQLSKR